jgi:hypothetical protein
MKNTGLNLTFEQYSALSKEERIELNKKLKMNTWHNYKEMYPDTPYQKAPCVINDVLIIG